MPKPPAYASILSIRQLTAEVHLGVGEEERRKKQPVRIDVKLYFPKPPPAASSDHADYTCYYDISQKIHALCATKEYCLIEYLAHEIHKAVRRQVPKGVKIAVLLHKLSIPAAYVKDGASYSYTDLPPFAWTPPEW